MYEYTDMELVLELIKRLNLREHEGDEVGFRVGIDYPRDYEYVRWGNTVRLGCGNGCCLFFSEFIFDDKGRIIEYGVFE